MSLMLTLAFLFFIGSVIGWVIELFFRRFISSANPDRKWINPGFCVGPYLPLYGSGLCILFLIATFDIFDWIESPFIHGVVMLIYIAVAMTLLEYIAGFCSLKLSNVRLWDYTDEWLNIQGIICPKFSFFWMILGGIYYFFIHPYILGALAWLSQNLAFSFVIGMFYGVFIIDVVHSSQILVKLRKYAAENDVILRYENTKAHIRSVQEEHHQKISFMFPYRTEQPLTDYLEERKHLFEKRIIHTRDKVNKMKVDADNRKDEIISNIKEDVKDIRSDIKDVRNDVKDNIKENISDVKDNINEVRNDVKDNINGVRNNIKDNISDIKDNLKK